MFRFNTKPQSFKEIIVSAFTLYWEGIQGLWMWSLVLAVVSSIPDWLMVFFMRRNASMRVLLSVDLFALLLLPIVSFIIGFIFYQLFLIGSQTPKKNSEVVSIVLDKLLWLSIALLISVSLTWLGLLFFIIPGIFIGVMLIFVQPLILLDDHPLFDAFKYSWFLVKKNWWHTFIVLTLPLLLFYVAMPSVYSGNPSIFRLLFDVIRMTLVIPLFFSFILTMFYDAKARHHVAMHLPRVKKSKVKTVGPAEAEPIE